MLRSLVFLPIALAVAFLAGCTSNANQRIEPTRLATDPAPYPGPTLVKHKPQTYSNHPDGEAVLAITVDANEQVTQVDLIRASAPSLGRAALVSAKSFGKAKGVPAGVYSYRILYTKTAVPPTRSTPDTYWVYYPPGRDIFLR